LAGRLIVVVGAGGAGKAIAYGAKKKGARVVIANRTYGKILHFYLDSVLQHMHTHYIYQEINLHVHFVLVKHHILCTHYDTEPLVNYLILPFIAGHVLSFLL
jgi:shikimate 5-dehydrogenase